MTHPIYHSQVAERIGSNIALLFGEADKISRTEFQRNVTDTITRMKQEGLAIPVFNGEDASYVARKLEQKGLLRLYVDNVEGERCVLYRRGINN